MKKNVLTLTLTLLSCAVMAQQKMSWDEAYQKADAKLASLTLEEKIPFLTGYSSFFFYGIPEKEIPYLYLSDATQGVHMRDNLSDPTMVQQLEKSTAYPSPIALAATFNPSLSYEYAKAVGEECRAGGIEILLGPGLNIYRNAQCGRNFEYFGEDPYLSSLLTAEYVRGIQSTGTAACLKHFIGNETEFYRRRSNSIIDERALHEIYMPPFKAGIDAGAAYVMTAYNQLNGEWTGQSKYVIKELLRNQLGFRGCVMSDWRSIYDVEKIVKSGQNVEMPGRTTTLGEVRELLKSGRIVEAEINQMVRPMLATGYAFGLYNRKKYCTELLDRMLDHKQTAYQVAAEATVLLRNNGILPLAPGQKILLTGRFIKQMPRTGGSSSASAEVIGYDNITLADAMQTVFGNAVTLIEKPSREQLAAADVVLFSTGTIDVESFERPFALRSADEKAVLTAVETNPNTIVLVNSGSGVRMTDWNDKAAAIIYGWYPGQTGFTALAEMLAGKINPSGKLPMTIEREFADSPAKGTMPVGAEFYDRAPRAYNEAMISLFDINYDEGVFVGYRWYENKGVNPLYPFGFGLSYTTFELTKPQASAKSIAKDGTLKVTVTLTNTGKRDGAQAVQLYVSEVAPSVARPIKELKGVQKIGVPAGKKQTVSFEVKYSDLAFWDVATHAWRVNPGDFRLTLGTSSADPAAVELTIAAK